ncbi:MAG: toll/interleukin-1 receptor domain-containing protein [Bryobacterales bacterium]|nr:toll/interleukin-1 receptor domain-containing protein [Bryobacterales bacterium]
MPRKKVDPSPPRNLRLTASHVARLVRACLDDGASVEIDGLGEFQKDGKGELKFTPYTRPMVFLAYADEDFPAALKLYEELHAAECDPWLDRQRLLPGQNWPRCIESAIDVADHFVALFSRRSANKRGQFQSELRYAMDCAARLPLDRTFFIPLRLDPCRVPGRIASSIQYVDLFPDWDQGVRRLIRSIAPRRHRKE